MTALVAIGLVGIASCSGSGSAGDGPATTPPTTSTPPTEAPTTSTVSPTTPTPSTVSASTSPVSPSTDPAPTTTESGSSELTLRADGLGVFSFGVEPTSVLAAATTVFGAPDQDDSAEYQASDELGLWTNGSSGFTSPHGRTVCWSDVLCLYLGGASVDDMRFVGWWYHDTTGAGAISLSTADGIAIGSVLSDHLDSIAIPTGGCYTETTSSTADGIFVSMYSVGEPFFTYDTTGAYIEGNPRPEDIVVRSLSAGATVEELDADC